MSCRASNVRSQMTESDQPFGFRSAVSEDPAGQRGGGRPVAAVQRGEGQQAARLRAGAQRMAVLGGMPRRAGVACSEFFETCAAAAFVTRCELA
jgi:hypothetical protein